MSRKPDIKTNKNPDFKQTVFREKWSRLVQNVWTTDDIKCWKTRKFWALDILYFVCIPPRILWVCFNKSKRHITIKFWILLAGFGDDLPLSNKWDPFIQIPPSELVTQFERHPPSFKMSYRMDEIFFKMLEIDKLFLELDHGRVYILTRQLHRKNWRT